MSTITVHSPVQVAVPRAAAWAASAFTSFLKWFERRQSAATTRQEGIDRQAQAANVRTYAMRFAGHDPRFAADLFAAADRHERGE